MDGDFVVGFTPIEGSIYLAYDDSLQTGRNWMVDEAVWSEVAEHSYLIRAVVIYKATGLIEELEGTSINVYPNPASEVLNIDATNDVQHLTLINPVGQVVYDAAMEANKTSIDLSEFPGGVYMVQLKKADGTVLSTKKVIIH
jgi:hypothetical protein